ncbi:UDP-D-xylose:ribitol-5-phosphate beta1,4-xylosyltransferase [Hondaea fermentalgiana]|uniref:UDP-D-xylose:ribitol-5-phosphate beta1,4-xylosyltransferase n=1 Tax=Hondaea fermentalgiana TaxID=2315210 RepID=A0A2R5G5S0_9STRA|nr:UDP-D-xylose:ribitol-5-phosphate beta1,4-xylosyltransferase [Hondaea fermentalgiana]|eukprot:GBG26387.1 UDP-D-xylose:ribitol-5-phosphate beta1,4-xylosyltransferase [Hondaea fermentalgiana]
MQKRQVGGAAGRDGGGGEASPLAALDKLSKPRLAALGADMDMARARRNLRRWRAPLALFVALVLVGYVNSRWLRARNPIVAEVGADEAASSVSRVDFETQRADLETQRADWSSQESATLRNDESGLLRGPDASAHSVTTAAVVAETDARRAAERIEEQEAEEVVDLPSLLEPAAMAPHASSALIKVCAVATNPRQGSIFRTNLMGLIGSGKYEYEIKAHGQCAVNAPRVRMIPYVKCCTDMAVVQKTIASSFKQYDIVIVTGDEYCAVRSTQFHYRQYHGDNVIGTGMVSKLRGIKLPLYFPLGPRAEFERVDQTTGVPAARKRQYAINFVGSPTSIPRRKLRDYFQSETWTMNPLAKSSYIHVTDTWTQTVSVEKGYITPKQYREVLLDSKFTLCPMGHNPEAYRIYEACEAGSVPVLVTKEEEYVNHKCSNAFQPLLDSGAPFVILDSWNDLPQLLEIIHSNQTFVEEKQRAVRAWYAEYMSKFALDFEEMLEFRYKLRVGKALQ